MAGHYFLLAFGVHLGGARVGVGVGEAGYVVNCGSQSENSV